MRTCGVCQLKFDTVLNMFEEMIGEPPVLISQVLLKCTRGTKRKFIRGGVCISCTKDLRKYYGALQTAKEIRKKIIILIESVADIELQTGYIEEIVHADIDEINNFEKEEYCEQSLVDSQAEQSQENSEEGENIEYLQEEYINEEEWIENDEEENLEQEENATEVEEELNSDTEDEGDENQNICKECGISFNNYRSYNQHRKTEHREKYICEHCGKMLSTAASLAKHVTLHNPDKPLACDVCGKRYHFEIDLNNHRAWHTGERPYECQVCGKRFVNHMSLCCHKMIHKDLPENISCEICGKKFRKRSRLKQHMYVHDTLKRFSCKYCDYSTANKYSLSFHLKNNKNCFELAKNDRIIEENARANAECINFIEI